MCHAKLFRFFTSFMLLGLAVVPHAHAHSSGGVVELPPGSDSFLPVTDAHRAAWERVIEDCLPVDTRSALSARCMTSLGDYFSNEPVWSYNYVFVYDSEGWSSLYHSECSQRRDHSPADFLDPDIPLWRDIFDDQIEQRQELFLQVVNDSVCQDLASFKTPGIHDDLAEQCAAREMYQYAAYLSACFDATQRLTKLQEIVTQPNTEGRAVNLFELSFANLDENVADAALRAAAKRHLEKRYLHASWVASRCNQHGLVLRPGVTLPAITLHTGQTFDSYTTTDKKLSWEDLKSAKARLLRDALYGRTHEFIMQIAMKSGDDWAIRSGAGAVNLGGDLMQRDPLLMHRLLGDSGGLFIGAFRVVLTAEERDRHRAKAYLLLVEAAGEDFARREYNPEPLAQQIQYIAAGGVLKAPPTRAEMIEIISERERQRDAKKEVQEVQGEEFK